MKAWPLVLLFLVCLSAAGAQSPLPGGVPDRPRTFLYDPTNLLSKAEQQELNSRLIAFRDSTSNELAVLILRSVPEGQVMEGFVNKVFNRWGIGSKEKNNGVLLAIFVDDRRMRIEVGYGLEPVLTDGITGHIQRETLRPAFREKEYARGIREAIELLEGAARGEFDEAVEAQRPWWERTIVFLCYTFIWVIWVSGGAIFLVRPLFLWLRKVCRTWQGKPHDHWGEPRYNTWYARGYESNTSSGGSSSSSSKWWSSSSSSSGSTSSSDFGGGSSGGGGSSSSW